MIDHNPIREWFVALSPHLDERGRIAAVFRATGIAPSTIERGLKELASGFGGSARSSSSVAALIEDLDRRGIRTKERRLAGGRVIGGIFFGVGPLAHLLKNRFYIGEVVYRGEVHRGEPGFQCRQRSPPRPHR